MSFVHRKACRRLGSVQNVSGMVAKLWRVRLDPRKSGRRLANVQSVLFDHRNACRSLAVILESAFSQPQSV